MQKLWLHCLLWSMPALAYGVDPAGPDVAPPVNAARASPARPLPALLANDRATRGMDRDLLAARHAYSAGGYAAGAPPRGRCGGVADIAAYMRLHRQARTDVPIEWQPPVECVLR